MGQQTQPHVEHRPTSFLAGFLSYLIPGLGQIYQGRYAKGILFMVCLLGMFFTGQALGNWQNVFLPDVARGQAEQYEKNPFHLPPILYPLANVYNRWHFAGQFWIGVAAWPAIWQYATGQNAPHRGFGPPEKHSFVRDFQRAPRSETEVNDQLRRSDKTPDLALVYTVIAGVLNILVIYDAYAGPAYGSGVKKEEEQSDDSKSEEKAKVGAAS